MDDTLWERYSYIMDLFEKDVSIYEAREEFNRLTQEMYAYAERQEEGVQNMIYSYMSSFLYINLRLFVLACQHFRLPDETIE